MTEAHPTSSDFERLGGEQGLRSLIDAFLDRVFDDFIIGFTFVGKDQARIRQMEYHFAAKHLGGGGEYPGRPLGRAHGPLKINKGQFRRRLAILRTVLREHDVPEDIIERWISHNQRFEAAVTDGSDCLPPTSGQA